MTPQLPPLVDRTLQRLIRAFAPEKILLFGSWAKGTRHVGLRGYRQIAVSLVYPRNRNRCLPEGLTVSGGACVRLGLTQVWNLGKGCPIPGVHLDGRSSVGEFVLPSGDRPGCRRGCGPGVSYGCESRPGLTLR